MACWARAYLEMTEKSQHLPTIHKGKLPRMIFLGHHKRHPSRYGISTHKVR
jgi:hypothetical protein